MITIGFFSSKFFLSRLIMWLTKSSSSHAAIGFTREGKQFFLHAAWGGVQITPREELVKNRKLEVEYQVLANFNDEIELALMRVGEKYNTIGLLGYIPVLIGRWFNLKISNPFKKVGAQVCSEFIITIDVNDEIVEFVDLDPSSVTPRDLHDICASSTNFQKLAP